MGMMMGDACIICIIYLLLDSYNNIYFFMHVNILFTKKAHYLLQPLSNLLQYYVCCVVGCLNKLLQSYYNFLGVCLHTSIQMPIFQLDIHLVVCSK
jgi:hypothetical protein